MHELSIASAILESVRRLTPPAAVPRAVELRAGPLRCIEPEAMLWAWKGVTAGTPFEDVDLELEITPWRLRCRSCGNEFETGDLSAPCPCGARRASPVGGDELRIVSLTVDDAAQPPPASRTQPANQSATGDPL